MKNSIKTIATMAILFWSGVTFATDSDGTKKTFRVKAEKENLYKVSYKGNEAVTLRILDDENLVVYSEKCSSDSFVKKYDLSQLPKGNYLIEVISKDSTYSEAVAMDHLSKVNMNLSVRADNKVALLGNNPKGEAMKLYVLDEARNVLHEEDLADNLTIHRQFDFSALKQDKVTFLIYNQEQVVFEKSTGFRK